MKRYLEQYILNDLSSKIILLTGPRQSGKTTLSKMINLSYDYLNYDNHDHRRRLLEKSWDRSKKLIIFDELHKMKNWKSWIKGIYDTEGIPPSMIVTGSAKLDTYRKVGDSLAGRFFQFRLHPLDLKEINQFTDDPNLETDLNTLLETGGFPEPYLKGNRSYYNRWKKTHLDIILKQDLVDLESVRQISSIETLIQLLKTKVGSLISYNTLARDLHCSDKTIKNWLTILENMYVIFKVPPFSKKISRSIVKAPKYYFYDTGQIVGDEGVRFENLIACALLKELHFREDCFGEEGQLHFLRNREGKEIDFLITKFGIPAHMIEVKLADTNLSPNFSIFNKYFDHINQTQVTKEIQNEKTYPNGAEIRKADTWLANFHL